MFPFIPIQIHLWSRAPNILEKAKQTNTKILFLRRWTERKRILFTAHTHTHTQSPSCICLQKWLTLRWCVGLLPPLAANYFHHPSILFDMTIHSFIMVSDELTAHSLQTFLRGKKKGCIFDLLHFLHFWHICGYCCIARNLQRSMYI